MPLNKETKPKPAVAWKKSHFILLDRSDFHMINDLSIEVCGLARRIVTSLLGYEMLLPKSTNFRDRLFGARETWIT